jgi:subtilisin-like proprotein convertase family protein
MKTIKHQAKSFRGTVFLLVLMIFPPQLSAQSCYNELVDTMISGISMQSISKIVHELTGDTSTIIGGLPYTILTRAYNYPGNQMAAQYILEKFASFGYTPSFQTFSETGKNVIAVKTGIRYPNKQFIICAHYDSYPFEPRSIGADDDATGVCGVLEAARVMAPYDFDYTVIYVAMDEEERWLLGSGAYADTALLRNDSIMNVINLDMTAYDANHDGRLKVITNNPSIYYANAVNSAFMIFQPELSPIVSVEPNAASDHYSFWERGFKAVWPFESDVNPYINSMYDTITHFNYDYFLKMTRGAAASLIVLAKDYIININHDPLQSTADTSARIVNAVITSNHPIARNWISRKRYAPRLYWKIGDGLFSWCNAFYTNLDTFKFLIPGQQLGTTVSYYISAQDSLGTMVGSLPGGAKGLSPPGTIPPASLFVYRILKRMNICSNIISKNIPPRVLTLDTILVTEPGSIEDYDLNLTIYHQNDSDLYIMLIRPGETQLQLSTGNGGNGQNYFNTTFDDEAAVPITEGTAPFIGSYRPETPLSTYDQLLMEGYWVLRIYNNSQTITGQLVNWCLIFDYYDPIGLTNNQIPVKSSLSQNYPNPFNSSTKINFSIPKRSHIKIAVYDVLGRELKLLANENHEPGDYSVTFNATNFSSGLYLYSFYLDGVLFGTKKMILVK